MYLGQSDLLRRAHLAVDADKIGSALRLAWLVVEKALREGDEESVRGVLDLANEISRRTSGRHHADAETLASYCQHSLDGSSGPIKASSLMGRLLRRDRRGESRRKCPECAESIAAEAKLCRFCGFRLEGRHDLAQQDRLDTDHD